MRSSDVFGRWRHWLAAACAAALSACNAPLAAPPVEAAAASALPCSVAADRLPPARAVELGALRGSVESNPLYAAVAAGRVPQCTVSAAGSQWQIDYRFAADAALRVTRDSSIEYTDYSASVAWPQGAEAPALLARSERAAFAPGGCGIDWQRPETRTTTTVPPGRLNVWRGSSCNCQGRVVEDAAGRTVGVGLRSAC